MTFHNLEWTLARAAAIMAVVLAVPLALHAAVRHTSTAHVPASSHRAHTVLLHGQASPRAASQSPREVQSGLEQARALARRAVAERVIRRAQQARLLTALHHTLWLHGSGTQLLSAWNAPVTLRAVNWYGFEYAPFVPDGLDRASLDSILALLRRLHFNALRLMFADATVEWNPVVTRGLDANPGLRGLHSLDIMQRILQRAHHYGLRVILCNSRSEPGRGPEGLTGLWYTKQFPESAWFADWTTLVQRFRHDSAFVAADLRNEPHISGSQFDLKAYFTLGPMWGSFRGTYYHGRDWHYAAQTLGNQLLAINPNLMIMVEGVQMYLDPDFNHLTGGLWGSNLIGVQYDPVVLSRPSQLIYSVHEYGPRMYRAKWFNAHTSYFTLARRWRHHWGYLLTAPRFMQAPIFVGEFGTCNDHYSCIASPRHIPDSQGFWFASFVHYLHEHPQVGWAYWSLNPVGPFRPDEDNFYSLMHADWRHYYPYVTCGLAPLLNLPCKPVHSNLAL